MTWDGRLLYVRYLADDFSLLVRHARALRIERGTWHVLH